MSQKLSENEKAELLRKRINLVPVEEQELEKEGGQDTVLNLEDK